MIKILEIENFQSHDFSQFTFSEGVNIIMGTSNVGKSSVIRALRWVIRNQPRSTTLKRHLLKDSDVLSVSILTDKNDIVTRSQANKINQYEITHKEKTITFAALKTDIPIEVKDILNLDELNIQSQFTPFFLIANTPGEVARTLNKYTGLEVIDKVLKAATSNIFKITNEITSVKSQIEMQKETITKYTNIQNIINLKNKLNKLINTIEELEKTKHNLIEILTVYKNTLQLINQLQSILKNKNKVNKIMEYIIKYNELKKEKNILSIFKQNIATTTQQIKNLQQQIKHKNNVEKIVDQINEYYDIIYNREALVTLCTEYKHINVEKQKNEDILNKHRKQLSNIKICPMCGGKWKGI